MRAFLVAALIQRLEHVFRKTSGFAQYLFCELGGIILEPTLAGHLFQVAQTIGRAQQAALSPRRIGVIIAGDEVPHVHLHVVPFDSVAELSFAHADPNPPEGSLDAAAAKLRAALRDQLEPAGADHVSE